VPDDLELSQKEAIRRRCSEIVMSRFMPVPPRVISAFALLHLSNRYASPREIRRAYRRLALQMHPDRGGDQERFQALQDAYETALEYSLATVGE
jgi:hypothetical protein